MRRFFSYVGVCFQTHIPPVHALGLGHETSASATFLLGRRWVCTKGGREGTTEFFSGGEGVEGFVFENNSEFLTWRMAPPGKFLLFIMFFEFSCGADCEMAPRKTLPTDYSLWLPLLGVSTHMALALFNVSIQLVNLSLSSIGGPHTGLPARTVLLS